MRPKVGRAALGAAILFAAACSGDGDGDGDGDEAAHPPPVFIAFEQDFQGFHAWPSFELRAGAGQGLAHLEGPRTEFINRRPARGATEFPIKTIIVKELGSGARPDRQVFAMVKRGGGYNADGARGWEWFELHNRADGGVSVLWRGVAPPEGESYHADPMAGGCNECHALAERNDFVRAEALDLGRPK